MKYRLCCSATPGLVRRRQSPGGGAAVLVGAAAIGRPKSSIRAAPNRFIRCARHFYIFEQRLEKHWESTQHSDIIGTSLDHETACCPTR
jgi:hypothetical protein